MTLRKLMPLLFSAFLMLALANPILAFGSSGADCNGDGENDVSCSGSVCISADEGSVPGGGYCECSSVVNGEVVVDRHTCDEQISIAPVHWLVPESDSAVAPQQDEASRDAEALPKSPAPQCHLV